MNFIKLLPIFIIILYSFKIIMHLITKKTEHLSKEIQDIKIQKGILSIKDLRKENYERFISTVKLFLTNNDYNDIQTINDGSWKLTNYIAFHKDEKIYISCMQNDVQNNTNASEDHLKPTPIMDIQCFVGRMAQNTCTKGIIINNSTFSKEAIKLVNYINNKNNNLDIQLIDGYTLTSRIRSKTLI